MGPLWYVPAAMPLGSRMGLGVDSAQTPEGSVEAPREGARDGTLDTGAEADSASDCGKADGVEDAGRDTWVSISRAVPARANMAVAGESLRRLQQSAASWWMGSSRTSWSRVRELSRCGVLMALALTWFVCGTACCGNMLSLPKVSDDLPQKEHVQPRLSPLLCVCVCVWPHLLGASFLFCIMAASFMAFSHVFMSSWVSALK